MTTINATIDTIALPVQSTINPVTSAVQMPGEGIPARRGSAVRLAIEATINSVSLMIQPVLDTVTAIAYTVACAVSAIGQCATAACQ